MSALAGHVALVTGASSGIGRAIALALGGAGARTWCVGRSQERLAAVAAQGGTALRGQAADLTRGDEVRNLAQLLRQEERGRLDLLVHCAGVIHVGPLAAAPVADLDAQYQANVRAPYLLTQMLLPLVRDSQGQIVFVNSSIIENPRPAMVQYSATQHALRGIADCLRAEVNEQGIRVLSVFPGRTATPRQEELYRLSGQPYRPELLMQPEDVARAVLAAVTMPRTVEMTNVHLRPMVKSY